VLFDADHGQPGQYSFSVKALFCKGYGLKNTEVDFSINEKAGLIQERFQQKAVSRT
jgi:hypothetical protein